MHEGRQENPPRPEKKSRREKLTKTGKKKALKRRQENLLMTDNKKHEGRQSRKAHEGSPEQTHTKNQNHVTINEVSTREKHNSLPGL